MSKADEHEEEEDLLPRLRAFLQAGGSLHCVLHPRRKAQEVRLLVRGTTNIDRTRFEVDGPEDDDEAYPEFEPSRSTMMRLIQEVGVHAYGGWRCSVFGHLTLSQGAHDVLGRPSLQERNALIEDRVMGRLGLDATQLTVRLSSILIPIAEETGSPILIGSRTVSSVEETVNMMPQHPLHGGPEESSVYPNLRSLLLAGGNIHCILDAQKRSKDLPIRVYPRVQNEGEWVGQPTLLTTPWAIARLVDEFETAGYRGWDRKRPYTLTISRGAADLVSPLRPALQERNAHIAARIMDRLGVGSDQLIIRDTSVEIMVEEDGSPVLPKKPPT